MKIDNEIDKQAERQTLSGMYLLAPVLVHSFVHLDCPEKLFHPYKLAKNFTLFEDPVTEGAEMFNFSRDPDGDGSSLCVSSFFPLPFFLPEFFKS